MTSTLPGDWDDLIIIAGGESWGEIWGSHRHLAEALSTLRPVLYVDQPVSALTRFRRDSVAGTGLRLVRPGLAVLVPGALPGLSRPGIRRTTEVLTRRAMRSALADLGSPHVAALVVAGLEDLFGACAADARILYATDDFAAGAGLMGFTTEYQDAGERRQAAKADGVVVVSDTLAQKWRSLGSQVTVVANGCDPETFADVDNATIPHDVHLRPPVAGMVGRLSARIDLALLEAVANEQCSVLLVGPRDRSFEPDRVDHLLARPNVEWVGRKTFETLPSYLRVIDVGMTPYADTAFNRASFPLKTLEYLAAGRAAVTSDLPATRALQDAHVEVAATAEEFASTVCSALARTRTPELVDERRKVARNNSWMSRAHQFLAAIDATRENQVSTT